MCGFCGIINFNNSKVSRKSLRVMTNKMLVRGPDSEGFYSDHNIGLGFRRLAIIDLTSGDQPLSNEDDSIWLVMNGEVYNFIELRNKLKLKGHIFKTGSDAEVILHLYEEFGADLVHHLNGMFAFALYDKVRKKMILGRDRLGIKPLFYKINKNHVLFGSDARTLTDASAPDISELGFLSFMSFGYTGQDSIFSDVHKLDPGSILEINGTSIKFKSYWSINEFGISDVSDKDAEEELSFLLKDSVRLQLRSDVPLGIFLSGGVDSSAIVALADEVLRVPVNTYSIEYRNKNGRDSIFAAQVSQQYKTNHTKLVIGPDEAELYLNDLLYLLDEPIADSAILATYALSYRAKQDGVKVLLSGAGGDEIFGGYSRYQRPKILSKYWLRNFILSNNSKYYSSLVKKIHPSMASRISNQSLNYAAQISGVDYSLIRELLGADRYESLIKVVMSEYELIQNNEQKIGYEYARMNQDLNGYLVNNILALTDKASMAASIEARVPLLDHRLVEYAYRLQSKVNMFGGQPKGLFKKTLEKRLSSDVLYRKKEGFNAPMKQWVSGGSGKRMKENLLGETSEALKSNVNMKNLEKMLSQGSFEKSGFETLFSLYMFNRWWNANYA